MMPPRVCVIMKAKFDRINTEMTPGEVQAILGRSADKREPIPSARWPVILLDVWIVSDEYEIAVMFENGKVTKKNWSDLRGIDPPKSVLDKIRHWLHLD